MLASPVWQDLRFETAAEEHENSDVLIQASYGTGLIQVDAIEFRDSQGHELHQIRHGQGLIVHIRCHAAGPVPGEAITFVVGFARQGFSYQAYIYEGELPVPNCESFVIESYIDEVQLGGGVWYVNVGIGAAGLFQRDEIPYFATDPSWYHMASGRLEFRVLPATKLDAQSFSIIPASVKTMPGSETSLRDSRLPQGA
jgi:hypothetical protein